MIKKKVSPWEIENSFYFETNPNRIAKIISHFEIFKKTVNVKGSIIECGVFKGNSLNRFIIFRDLLLGSLKKKVYGFDVFGKFPSQKIKRDNNFAKKHDKEIGLGINYKKLKKNFQKKGFKNFFLIKGSIEKTLVHFLKNNKNIKISFLHLDLDVYRPTFFALTALYDRVSKGGIILLDDYGKIHGATKATKDFFKSRNIKYKILSTKFDKKLKFIIKK